MDSYGDLVAAEDVLLFVNAAITSTGQREFHDDADGQRLSLDFLHAYMLGNYRDLYAGVLALDINDHNAVLVIRRLLETAGEATAEQRRSEGALIASRLTALPPQRVYGLFDALRRAGVNNRRTRAIVRDWLASRKDLAFDAVKYRSGLKRVLRHTHLTPANAPEELGTFLFAPHTRARYATPLLESWRRAHYEQAALYELPYTAAEGFAAKHGIARAVFLERMAPRMTRLETLRLQASAHARGATGVRADLAGMPLTRLAAYVLSLPAEDRLRRRAELTGALESAAGRVAAHQEAGARSPPSWTTASPPSGRSTSAAARWRWRWPATTCSRPSPASTPRCGRPGVRTRCWRVRTGRRPWAGGSSTRWRPPRHGW